MVTFCMRSPMRRVVLLAAAHGMTDMATAPAMLLPYSVIAMPLPGWLTTALFGAASIVHFASDIGLGLSTCLHLALTAAATVDCEASFFAMSCYFCFVHTPMHYMRLLMQQQVAAVATALTITAVMAVISAVPAWSARATQLLPKGARLLAPFSERDGERGAIHVTHMMQRLVLAHVRLSLSNAR